MTWDATAYQVTIKAIGTVESNMNYGASSVSDPITIGILQWYGTRAANLLFEVQSSEPSIFSVQCPSTIQSAMSSHSATDTWWNRRTLTKEERAGLFNLLTNPAVIAIQDSQMQSDIDDYLAAADAWGIDKDTETEAAEFFCTVYNQSPRAASQICAILPAKCTLSDIYHAALNNSIVGTYRNRQDTAYNIVKTQDTSGVGSIPTVPPPSTSDGGDGNEASPQPSEPTNVGSQGQTVQGDALYITDRGHLRILHRRNGRSPQSFYKSGGVYLASADSTVGSTYPSNDTTTIPTPPPTATPPINTDPGGPVSGAAAAIIAWCRSKIHAYSYSQGPGRLNPEKSGYCDCSGFLVYAFQHAGNISLGGTYTGNLWNKGTLIYDSSSSAPAESLLNPGDLIFIRFTGSVRGNSPFDHVEMYTDTHTRISMGHTPGPDEFAWDVDINDALAHGGRVRITRHI